MTSLKPAEVNRMSVACIEPPTQLLNDVVDFFIAYSTEHDKVYAIFPS